ncbi:MAG: tetratricopeptide repeat protein, partial [Planctomycetaceae bacterium]|nr:tetratricopeptide repeat protein [Planctomycetaceae bacterium]
MNRITFPLFFALLFAGAAGSTRAVFADEASNQFNAAKAQFDSKQYEAARSGFDAFLTRFPANTQASAATFYLAESLMFLKRYSLAESYYSRLTALGLNDQYAKVALFRLADILYIQGQYETAKPRLEEFVEKLPHDTNLQFVLYYLGDIAMRNNAAQEAEWYFAQTDRIFPDGAKAVENKLGLAWAKNKLGKQTEADAIYQQLMNSNSPAAAEQAAYQWGVALFERGAFQESVAAFAEFQRKYPASASFADAYRVIARCKGRLNDFDGALQTLTLISPPSTDDKLMKVRMLYGLKKNEEAKTALTDAERTATAAYRDEIALLKSVFLFDQRDWKSTITLLESVLAPQFDAAAGRMTLTYASLPIAGVNKLGEVAQYRAYSLLTQAYARNGETAKANAMLAEMQKQASGSDKTVLTTICTDTSAQLASIEQGGWGTGITRPPGSGGTGHRPNRPSDNTAHNGSNNGQWSPNQPPNNGLTAFAPITDGTDLDKFWRAMQMYDSKNYAGAAQQLEQILTGYYNQTVTPKQYSIYYNITGAEGKFDDNTFAKACSVLALSKAGLGDMEQAYAVLAAFASRIRMTDTVQKTLLQTTQQQLLTMSGSANNPPGGGLAFSVLSDADQR